MIHHIAIRANDFEVTLRFYQECLGSPKVLRQSVPRAPRFAFVEIGDDSFIEVFDKRALGGDAQRDGPKSGLIHYCLGVEDVNLAYLRALGAGAEALRPPFDSALSEPEIPERVAFVYGPDGEVIEFHSLEWIKKGSLVK